MPPISRSQSSRRRPLDSPPPPGLQPTPPRRRRQRRSSIADDDDDDGNNNNNKTETVSDDEEEEEADTTKEDDDQKRQAIQLNLPLVLPPPFKRQLLSLCFHASWRTRRRLRIHFSNRSEVLLEYDSSPDSSDSDSDGDSDPEHQHDKLTVIDYDPVAVPLHPRRLRWLVPLIITCFVATAAAALILAAVLGRLQLQPGLPPLRLPSFGGPPPRPRPITLHNLTALTHPYARLVRLLDTATPTSSSTSLLAAIRREFAELCGVARVLAIPPDACYDIMDLLDDAGVHLAGVLAGTRAQAGPGNLVSALRDTVLLMAWGIDRQQQQEEQEEGGAQEDGGGGGRGTWNATAEGVFCAVIGQLPNWWDDHNALAVPLQSALEALRQARGMEGDVLASFKRAAVGSSSSSFLDPNEFPTQDVLYAYDRLFTPLLPRRDTLMTTLEAATGLLDDAARRVYEFNATMHGTRAQAKKNNGGVGYAFEGVDVLLGRVKEAVGVLEHEMEAVEVRERQRGRDDGGKREREEEEEAREVEERRPRRRREREEEEEERERRRRRLWWKRG